MKVENLVLAKCIKNIDPWSDKNTGLEIGKYYVIEEINIGQSKSSIKINGKSYNSILFEYYNDYLEEENKKYKNQQKEFIEFLEKEKDRLARECSPTYEGSLGKKRFVNEDIFNEVDKILSKYYEIIDK